ncbi:zinc finger BED domain-containing protein RICESLEEPER 1-like isoform X2 [Carex rostrata]
MSNSVGGCDHVEGGTSKKRRSEVWIYFDKTPDNKKAICKYCGRSMVAESKKGTSHLIRHIKVCKKRQQDVDQPVTMGIRDEVRKFGWTNKRYWEVQVMKAIIAEAPFLPSDCKEVQSRLMGPIDLDKEIGLYYEQEKEKLANEFKHLTSRVCFSYEIIEERVLNLNYISITAHFINEDFNLVNKLIGFKKLTNISESCVVPTIEKCISGWELGDKIFSFTGKDHPKYVRSLRKDFSPIMSLDGPYFHLPCYKIGLTSFYSGSLAPLCSKESANIWNLIESMKAVGCDMDTFNEIAKERGLPPINEDWLNQYAGSSCKGKGSDPGRREHAVKMLKEAILYKDVIGNCSKGHDIDWERVEVVVKLSDKVHEIIDTMASFNYPTFNLYFRNHAEIEDIWPKKEDFAITINYWLNDPFWNSTFYCKENKIIFVACALDPRYKLRFLNYYSEKIAKRNRPEFTKEYTNEICEFLENFFGEYKGKTTEFSNPQEGCTSNSAHLNPIIDGFSMYTKELKKTAPKSELEEYLNDVLVDLDDASFNLLGWWKHNRLRYPVLSKMARDVLAVPTCVYSIKGNMISGLRAFEGASPQLVEAVICSKDWIITTDKESNN